MNRLIPSRLASSLAVAFMVSLIPVTSRADNVEEGMQHYQQGVQLFKDGAYDAALVELERAYKVAPTYKLLFNIAQVYRQLNDFARAYSTYDRYLREGGVDIAPARRDEVRLEMVKLAARIGRVQIVTNAKSYEVTVDDVAINGGSSGAPIPVNAGRRRVAVKDKDRGVEAKVVDVAGGDSVRVDLTFLDVPTPAGSPDSSFSAAPAAAMGPINYTPVWIAASVTAALAVAGGVTGGIALGAKSTYNDELRNGPNNGDAIDSAHQKAALFAATTDALLGAAVVGGIVTVILLVTRHPSSERTQSGGLGWTLAGGRF